MHLARGFQKTSSLGSGKEGGLLSERAFRKGKALASWCEGTNRGRGSKAAGRVRARPPGTQTITRPPPEDVPAGMAGPPALWPDLSRLLGPQSWLEAQVFSPGPVPRPTWCLTPQMRRLALGLWAADASPVSSGV